MKNKAFKLILFVMLATMIVGLVVGCDNGSHDGDSDTYPFVVKNGVITDYIPQNADTLDRLVIPGVIGEQTITGIDEEVFQNGIAMCKEITIPNTIEWIGKNAFSESGFEKVYYLGTVDDWVSIRFLSIGANPISTGKTELYINNELLSEVNLTTVKKVKQYAFSSYAHLTKLTISGEVEEIEKQSISGYYKLDSVTIGASVTVIEKDAILCSDEFVVRCEASAKPSGWEDGWTTSKNIVWNCATNDVAEDGFIHASVNDIKYLLKDGIATVTKQKSDITTLNIPQTVTYKNKSYTVRTIADEACKYCSKLTSLTIPNSVTSIGDYAFYGTKITSLTIPLSVTKIGFNSFDYIEELTSITYIGTMDQWESIDKDYDVFWGTGTEVIHCKDGDIEID